MSELRIRRYRVRRDVASLAEVKGRPEAGSIIVTGRVLVLHCPACGALQFTPREVTGHDEAPNVLEPIQCGAGFCRRCGVWFRIVTGEAQLVAPEGGAAVAIPDKLARAGVARPAPLKAE